MAYDPLSYVPEAQNLAQTGVTGAAQAALPGYKKLIGQTLGDLNSSGSLRSGAVTTNLNDITNQYASQVGNYAKMAAGESLGAGLGANEQALMKQQLDQRRKAGLLGAIGSVLGTGLGFAGAGGLFGQGIQNAFSGGRR